MLIEGYYSKEIFEFNLQKSEIYYR